MSSDFYARLTPFHDFAAQAMDADFYRELPADWWVLVADITGSTQAVQAGRYVDVNYVGAACIVAVRNALGGHDVPSVFGGDGATVAVPDALKNTALAALLATRAWSSDAFGLGLRVGAVPVSELRARGTSIEIAKLEFSPGNAMAMFRGAGFDLADALVKDPDAGFRVDELVGRGTAPDLASLSCRWSPMASRNGRILCLIVGAGNARDIRASDHVYRGVLQGIDALVGLDSESASPVKLGSLRFGVSWHALEKEARTGSGPPWRRWVKAVLVFSATALIFRAGLRVGRFDPTQYRREMTLNADFRKVNGMLRLVLDCTEAQCDAIEAMLEAEQARGRLRFGAHRTSHAVMTCVAPSPVDHLHVHYIDGGDGGLWMAARRLKANG